MGIIKAYFWSLVRVGVHATHKVADFFVQPVLRKVAFYFIKATREQLVNEMCAVREQVLNEVRLIREQGLNEVSLIREQTVKEIHSIREFSQRLADLGLGTGEEAGAAVNASILHEIFFTVTSHYQAWSNCALILTCPLLEAGVKSIFPDKKIVVIRDPGQIFESLRGVKVEVLGVLSPWLAEDLLKDKYSPFCLLMACRRRLLLMVENKEKECVNRRVVMHGVGFYEIARSTFSGLDEISIGCLPNGKFQLFGSAPGFALNPDAFVTINAFRLPESEPSRALWRNVFVDPIKEFGLGYGVSASQFGLAVTTVPLNKNSEFIEIQGKMCWSVGGEGHASLVGCYTGPFDSHMYACLFQVLHEPVVSLWINNGEWRQLDACTIPCNKINHYEWGKEIPLWFRVSESTLSVGTLDCMLLEQPNVDLERVPVFGIRFSGDSVRISDVSLSSKGLDRA